MAGEARLSWELERLEDRKRWWVRDDLYTLEPRTPLSADVYNHFWNEQALWIAEKMSVPDSKGFNVITVNGYTYLGPLEVTDEDLVRERAQVFQARLEALIRDVEVDIPRYRSEQETALAGWKGMDLSRRTAMELLESWRQVVLTLDRFYKIHFLIVFPRHVVTGMLHEIARDAAGIQSQAEIGKLVQSMGVTRQLHLDMGLWRLAAAVIALGLRDTFLNNSAEALGPMLRVDVEGRAWWEKLDEFLAEDGGRLIVPKELSSPTWQEHPVPVLETIRMFVGLGAVFDFDGLQKDQTAEREQVVDTALARLRDGKERGRFEQLLGMAQRLQVAMEDDNFYVLNMGGQVRRVALEIGRRLTASAALGHPEDVFFLHHHEVESLLTDSVTGIYAVSEVRGLVSERRALRTAQRASKPPAYLGSPPQEIHHFLLNNFWGIRDLGQLRDEGRVISGIGASDGTAEGIARVVLQADELKRVQGGEILVVPATNPAWTPIFSKISGVVTDQGGSLSHAAIVAREYGIPAVLGTQNGTQRIPDGARVRVDGRKGEVEIL